MPRTSAAASIRAWQKKYTPEQQAQIWAAVTSHLEEMTSEVRRINREVSKTLRASRKAFP